MINKDVDTRLTAEQFWLNDYAHRVVAENKSEAGYWYEFAEAFRDKSEAPLRKCMEEYEDTIIEQCVQLQGLREEIERLRAWKESQISVTPDWQEIGKLLNIGLGQSVTENIIPAITALRAKLAELQKAVWAMTPGGSEFANDTERCLDFVRERLRSNVEQVKLRKAAEAEAAALRERERWIDGTKFGVIKGLDDH